MFGFMNSGKSKPVKKGLKIIIVGCGKVGTTLVEQLSKEGHDIIIIDKNAKKVQEIANMYDIMGIVVMVPVIVYRWMQESKKRI